MNSNYLLSTSFSPSCDCRHLCFVALDSCFNTETDKTRMWQPLPSFCHCCSAKVLNTWAFPFGEWCKHMARCKLVLISFNTDKYYDLIILFSPPPLSLEENMSADSESHVEGKTHPTPYKVHLPNLLPNNHSDSSLSIWLCMWVTLIQSAIPHDQQQGLCQ